MKQSQEIIKNPFRPADSPLDKYCLLKSAFVGGAGYVMGLGIAIFMNAMEFREIDTSKNFKVNTRNALMVDIKKIKSTARGFAVFGALFALFECMVEKQRLRRDGIGCFFGGGCTTMFIAMDSGMKWKGLMFSGIGGGMFGVVMESIMEGYFWWKIKYG